MKVTISVFGRFYFFDLALQLERHKLLDRLITSYPYFKVKEWGIPRKKVIAIYQLEFIKRLIIYFGLYSRNIDMVFKIVFGQLVGLFFKNTSNVFIFLAGNGYNTSLIKKLQRRGVICIADEASAHVLTQNKLLESEYRKLGLKNSIIPKEYSVKKVIEEYEISDYIVVPSTFVKQSLIENGINEEKIYVNPYGVDINKFRKVVKKDEIFRVIYFGTLSIQKGSHYLLQAFTELNLENSELWHAGEILQEMDQFIKTYKSDNIKYLGIKPQNELFNYYSQGSVFVLPSVQDGYGLVAVQALACGVPVICTTNSCGYDLISKSNSVGFVIPSCDLATLKEKIVECYSNPEKLRKMSENATVHVSSMYTWDHYGDRYMHILNKVSNK